MRSNTTSVTFLLSIILISLWIWHWEVLQPAFMLPTASSPAGSHPGIERWEQARTRVQSHLTWLEKESEILIQLRLQETEQFFAAAKRNTPAFAEQVRGWGSKWRFITDHLPWIGTDGAHERFLAQKFAEFLFSAQKLEILVIAILAGLDADLRGLESQLLVKLQKDVETGFEGSSLAGIGLVNLEPKFKEAVGGLAQAARLELGHDTVQILVSAVLTETLVQVATRLGISGSVLGSGLIAGGPSLGTTLVIALFVDQIVGWIYDYYADPQGELVRTLNQWLDDLHRTLQEGTKDTPGMRPLMQNWVRNRLQAQRLLTEELFSKKEVQP